MGAENAAESVLLLLQLSEQLKIDFSKVTLELNIERTPATCLPNVVAPTCRLPREDETQSQGERCTGQVLPVGGCLARSLD